MSKYQPEKLEKLYYTIGEVATLFDINTSNIRYWEKEFPKLTPKKTKGGTRKYSRENIATIATIYHLVKERGFTVEGARNKMKENKADVANTAEVYRRLGAVKEELTALLNNLEEKNT